MIPEDTCPRCKQSKEGEKGLKAPRGLCRKCGAEIYNYPGDEKHENNNVHSSDTLHNE